ncbi:MAG: hypothetical protein V2J65_37995, partial [Desulfobacteraceae bacterium]|nr:hypothetical protein [Desulfobacteraceae bacterium]
GNFAQLPAHRSCSFFLPLARLKHSIGQDLQDHFLMKSLRGKPRSILFLGFNSLLSQQAAGNLTRER